MNCTKKNSLVVGNHDFEWGLVYHILSFSKNQINEN
jgi:hypothetical protein